MLSTKYLVFKKRLARNLTEQYIGLYIIEKVVSTNIVKLRLLNSMRIHPVVNISQVVKYRELVRGQTTDKLKPVEVDRAEE